MVTVTVDVDTDELIDAVESLGFEVLEANDPRLKADFEIHEIRTLVDIIEAQSPPIGSELYFIREKLIRCM